MACSKTCSLIWAVRRQSVQLSQMIFNNSAIRANHQICLHINKGSQQGTLPNSSAQKHILNTVNVSILTFITFSNVSSARCTSNVFITFDICIPNGYKVLISDTADIQSCFDLYIHIYIFFCSLCPCSY